MTINTGRRCLCGSRCTTAPAVVIPDTELVGNPNSPTVSYLSLQVNAYFKGPYYDMTESGPADPVICGSIWPEQVVFCFFGLGGYGVRKSTSGDDEIHLSGNARYAYSPIVNGTGGAEIDTDLVDAPLSLSYVKKDGLWRGQFTEFAGQSLDNTLVVEAYPISYITPGTAKNYICFRFYCISGGSRITPIFGTRCSSDGPVFDTTTVWIGTGSMYSTIGGTVTGDLILQYKDVLPKALTSVPVNYHLDFDVELSGPNGELLAKSLGMRTRSGISDGSNGTRVFYDESATGIQWSVYAITDRDSYPESNPDSIKKLIRSVEFGQGGLVIYLISEASSSTIFLNYRQLNYPQSVKATGATAFEFFSVQGQPEDISDLENHWTIPQSATLTFLGWA